MNEKESKKLRKYLKALDIIIEYIKENPFLINVLISSLEKLKNNMNENQKTG